VHWEKLASGVAFSLVLFVLLCAKMRMKALTVGVIAGVFIGVGIGVGFGIASNMALARVIAFILTFGWCVGVACGLDMAWGIAFGAVFKIRLEGVVIFGSGWFVFLMMMEMHKDMRSVMILSMASALMGFIFYSRFHIYLLECLGQSLLYLCQHLAAEQTLKFSPILHHNLIYFPLPFLASHIVLTGQTDPALARRALDACAIAPGQHEIGRIALARLQA
jgi:hypothetical protein